MTEIYEICDKMLVNLDIMCRGTRGDHWKSLLTSGVAGFVGGMTISPAVGFIVAAPVYQQIHEEFKKWNK